MSIKDQILKWGNEKGLEVIDNSGYLSTSFDTIDFEVWGNVGKIKVRECKKYTYIYLPIPTNTPYKHKYQFLIKNGKAFLYRYLF